MENRQFAAWLRQNLQTLESEQINPQDIINWVIEACQIITSTKTKNLLAPRARS